AVYEVSGRGDRDNERWPDHDSDLGAVAEAAGKRDRAGSGAEPAGARPVEGPRKRVRRAGRDADADRDDVADADADANADDRHDDDAHDDGHDDGSVAFRARARARPE